MLEILTDDETLRMQGMTEGPKKVGKFKMRPMTPLTLSWCQRNNVFDDEFGDPMQKTAAFVFLHTEPKEVIRSVVHNKTSFANAVDDWIEKHVQNHHTDLEPYSQEMNASMQQYLAAISHSKSIGSGEPGPKN
jgi:hypothetical protein